MPTPVDLLSSSNNVYQFLGFAGIVLVIGSWGGLQHKHGQIQRLKHEYREEMFELQSSVQELEALEFMQKTDLESTQDILNYQLKHGLVDSLEILKHNQATKASQAEFKKEISKIKLVSEELKDRRSEIDIINREYQSTRWRYSFAFVIGVVMAIWGVAVWLRVTYKAHSGLLNGKSNDVA